MQQAQITAYKKRYKEKVERRDKEKRNETDEQKENYKNGTGTYHFDTQKNIENSSRQNQKKEKKQMNMLHVTRMQHGKDIGLV